MASATRIRCKVTTITDTAVTLTPQPGQSSLKDLGWEITTIVVNRTDITGVDRNLNLNAVLDVELLKK